MEDSSECREVDGCIATEPKFTPKVTLTIPVTPPKPVSKETTAKLLHEDKKLKLPPIPPSTVVPDEAGDSKHLEQSIEPYHVVTSQPCNLEEFYKKHDFPQIVRVVHGYFGAREEDIISVGQELLLFFVKSSQVIVASSNQSKQHYYITLNSSLWFVPYYESASDAIASSYEHCYQYRTVEDLLKRKGEIPKVVKVCKTYNGKSPQSSVVAGELIFPQKLKVLQTISNRKRVLECLNNKKELLQLELACEGNFSVHPMDIKMHIEKFIQYFSTFPVSVRVINDHKGASFSLSTGTVLSLKEFKTLQSYIFSTDIFGKKNYPLMELLMTVPIQIQCIEYPDLDIRPIYNAIRYTYESLVVKRRIFPTQNGLYEELQRDDGTTHIYDDLETPGQIYEKIPEHAKDIDHPYAVPVKNSPSFIVTPPIPPPRHTGNLSATIKNPFDICKCHPVSVTNTSAKKLSAPVSPTSTVSYADIYSSKESPSVSKISVPQSKGNCVVSHLATTHLTIPSSPSSPPSTNVTTLHSSKEENLAYLKSLNLSDMLQLLDNMNLGEHKESFKDENIDGEMMIHLDRADLVDLGVNKRIQQMRLLQLIDGSMSAKKFYNGGRVAKTTII